MQIVKSRQKSYAHNPPELMKTSRLYLLTKFIVLADHILCHSDGFFAESEGLAEPQGIC
jgi:hypothetical protein